MTAVKDGDRDTALSQMDALAKLVPLEEQGKTMAGNGGVIGSCAEALDKMAGDAAIAAASMKLVLILIVGNDFNRDKLKEPLANPGIASVSRALAALPGDADVQEAGFRLVKTAATKSESIKASFMEYDGIKPMRQCFERHMDRWSSLPLPCPQLSTPSLSEPHGPPSQALAPLFPCPDRPDAYKHVCNAAPR